MANTRRKRINTTSQSLVDELVTGPEEKLSKYPNPILNSKKLEPSIATQTIYELQDEQGYYDEDNKQNIFISEEQEKVIKHILELCRKGKINAKNAFEIPIKIMPDSNSNNNLKFWRMASEMLGASINIYEKRVENVYNETYKINGGLMRVVSSVKQDDNVEENEERVPRDAQLMQISIKQFNNLESVDKINVGQGTVERDIQKLDISNYEQQFLSDPIFEKTSMLFDESSAQGLLLNSFKLSDSKQIILLSQQQYPSQSTIHQNYQYINRVYQPIQTPQSSIFQDFLIFEQQLEKEGKRISYQSEQPTFYLTPLEAEEKEAFMSKIEIQQKYEEYPIEEDSKPISQQAVWNRNNVQDSTHQVFGSLSNNVMPKQFSNFDEFSQDIFEIEDYNQRDQQVGKGAQELFTFVSPWDMPNIITKKRKKIKAPLQPLIKAEKKNSKKKSKHQIDFSYLIREQLDQLKVMKVSDKILKHKLTPAERFHDQKSAKDNVISRDFLNCDKNIFVELSLKSIVRRVNKTQPQTYAKQQTEIQNTGQLHSFTFEAQNNMKEEEQHDQQDQLEEQKMVEQAVSLQFNTYESRTKNTLSIKQFKSKLLQQLQHTIPCKFTSLRHNDKQVTIQTKFITLLHLANQYGYDLREQAQQDIQIRQGKMIED